MALWSDALPGLQQNGAANVFVLQVKLKTLFRDEIVRGLCFGFQLSSPLFCVPGLPCQRVFARTSFPDES